MNPKVSVVVPIHDEDEYRLFRKMTVKAERMVGL